MGRERKRARERDQPRGGCTRSSVCRRETCEREQQSNDKDGASVRTRASE